MSFLDAVDQWKRANQPAPERPTPAAPAPFTGTVTAYAEAALSREATNVALAPEGTRNHTLNTAAYNLAQLAAGGEISLDTIGSTLMGAAKAAGLDTVEAERTIRSGLRAGAEAPRTTPNHDAWLNTLPEGQQWPTATMTASQTPSHAPTATGPDYATPTMAHVGPATETDVSASPTTTASTTPPDATTPNHTATGTPVTEHAASATAAPTDPTAAPPEIFNHDLALEIHRLRVRDAANRHLTRERNTQTPPQHITLPAFLNQPDTDPTYRIDRIWPTGGRIIFAAQYKAGKSTAIGNIIRSLADGTPYLDHYDTAPARVTLIDNELDPRTLRRWLRDQGITNPDAVTLIPLRGKVSAFDILDPEIRHQWAAQIKAVNAEIIILDCLRPVLDSLGLSEDKDAGKFLVAFDALLDESGAQESIVVHHMGHNGERSRGDSRILDWPDATWRLVRDDPDDPSSARYFSAFGRDVDEPEAMLGYDPDTRHLTHIGGDRRTAKIDGLIPDVVEIVRLHPRISGRGITNALVGDDKVIRKAIDGAVTEGLIMKFPADNGNGYAYVVR